MMQTDEYTKARHRAEANYGIFVLDALTQRELRHSRAGNTDDSPSRKQPE